MFDGAIRSFAANPDADLRGESLVERVEMEKGEKSPQLMPLLRYLKKTGANDMVFTAGSPPSIKVSNSLKRLAVPPLSPDDCIQYARQMLSDKEWQAFLNQTDYDFARLVRKGLIGLEDGLNHCEDDTFFRGQVQAPGK